MIRMYAQIMGVTLISVGLLGLAALTRTNLYTKNKDVRSLHLSV